MTALAVDIYQQLLRHLRAKHPSITYAELATKVGAHPRSPVFYAALTEVTSACRANELPCLPAIVWRSGTRRPSTGYFAAAHPRARTDRSRLAAWEREHAEVIAAATRFPATLS
jgi:hypothetical protein